MQHASVNKKFLYYFSWEVCMGTSEVMCLKTDESTYIKLKHMACYKN